MAKKAKKTKVETGVVVKDREKIKAQNLTILETAKDLIVHDQESVDEAVELLKGIKVAMGKVDDTLGPQVKAAYDSWQISLKQKKLYMEPLKEATTIIKDQISEFELEQDRIREEKERKAALAAKKAEDRKRKKLEEKLAKAADEEEAAIIEEEIEEVHVAPKVVDKPKTKGKASQSDIKVEVIKLDKLVQYLAGVPINYDTVFKVKVGGLKAYVKMTGLKKLPGCLIRKSKIQRLL